MSRHAATDSPTRLAAWIWVVLAALLIAAVVVAWTVISGDDEDSTTAECIDGDQELLVWVDPAAAEIAEQLVDDYNDASPVVHHRHLRGPADRGCGACLP